jgi:hypothetical protein
MNEFEPELLETELQRLKPAPPPEEFMERCADTFAAEVGHQNMTHVATHHPAALGRLLRWLAPVTAAAAIATLFFIKPSTRSTKVPAPGLPAQAGEAMKADDVEIIQELVATFDAVAHLPSGEPVRFRCSEWFDDVVLRDSTRGILIQHRVPRLEVEPVSFEIY